VTYKHPREEERFRDLTFRKDPVLSKAKGTGPPMRWDPGDAYYAKEFFRWPFPRQKEVLSQIVKELDHRELAVVEAMFGLGGREPLEPEKVAQKLNLSLSEIMTAHTSAMNKIDELICEASKRKKWRQ